jgi:hypothetical protein
MLFFLFIYIYPVSFNIYVVASYGSGVFIYTTVCDDTFS